MHVIVHREALVLTIPMLFAPGLHALHAFMHRESLVLTIPMLFCAGLVCAACNYASEIAGFDNSDALGKSEDMKG